MSPQRVFNVLFLCTGNSARSILAEAILNKIGNGRFHAFSAGSWPKGQVHPGALRLLQARGYPTEALRPKSWDEFARPGAPEIDLIITVCDNAAGEVCPVWPGRPVSAHWGLPDPAAVEGDEAAVDGAFDETHRYLRSRLLLLASLNAGALENAALKARLTAIHESADANP
ncbi:MAG: arsenate reductase ArsC [Brevundimonas sp.]|nr:arsenate reductase ArsC [Brevundimonas sp.]